MGDREHSLHLPQNIYDNYNVATNVIPQSTKQISKNFHCKAFSLVYLLHTHIIDIAGLHTRPECS